MPSDPTPATNTRSPQTGMPVTIVTTTEMSDNGERRDKQLTSIGHDTHLASGRKSTERGVGPGIHHRRRTGGRRGHLHFRGHHGQCPGRPAGDRHHGKRRILGPKADIHGDVIAIGGEVKRADGAVIHGNVNSVTFPGSDNFEWLHAWLGLCLFEGRPLAIGHDLGLVWAFALVAFAIYLALAALFRGGVGRCQHTLTTRPGGTVVTAILTGLLVPIVTALLVFSVVGIALLPFFGAGLLLAAMFGQVTLLAWVGGKVLRPAIAEGAVNPVMAVLVGGIVALALYLIPVIGFIVFLPMAWLGLGAVIYPLSLGMRRPPAPARAQPAPEAAIPVEGVIAVPNNGRRAGPAARRVLDPPRGPGHRRRPESAAEHDRGDADP